MGGQDTSIMPKILIPSTHQRARASAESNPVPPPGPPPLEPYDGYRRINLTLNVVDPSDRDKFHSLSRPETFREIRPGREPGQSGAYSVEMTHEEYQRAQVDAQDASVNLLTAQPQVERKLHAIPDAANLTYINALAPPYDGTGAKIGLVDDGLSAPVAAILGSQIFASNDVTGGSSALSTPAMNFHGSFMAGIAVPPGAQVAIAKAWDNSGNGIDEFTAAAIYWLVDNVSGIHVINLSFGAEDRSDVEADAVAHAIAQGIVVCSSAGNSGTDVLEYPSSLPGVLKITNYNSATDSLNPSSSFGGSVFAAAGGVNVTSYAIDGSELTLPDGGSSSTTAFCTRLVALEVATGKSPSAARNALAANARSTGAGASYEGHGVLRLLEEPGPSTDLPDIEGAPDIGSGPGMGSPEEGADPVVDPDTGEVIVPGHEGGSIIKTPPGQGITKVDFPFYLRDDGTVWWIHPHVEQIGEGFKDISWSFDGLFGIKVDGSVWMWGNNSYFSDPPPQNTLTFEGGGPPGDELTPFFNRVTNLPTADRFTDAGGHSRAMVIDEDDNLWAWGPKASYFFDNTNATNTYIPPENVRGLTNVKDAFSDLQTHFVLFNDGTIQAWGFGLEIGFPAPIITRTAPTTVDVTDVTQFSVNEPSNATYATGVFLKENGDVWHATSLNSFPAHVLVLAPDSPSNVTQVSASRDVICAITIDHQLWTHDFRNSTFGEFGDPSAWEQEPDHYGWATVRVHPYPMAEFHATQCDCSLWRISWDADQDYYLETHVDNRMNRLAADEILEPFYAAVISSNDSFAIAKNESGEVFGWGDGSYGNLGNGEMGSAEQPTRAPMLDVAAEISTGNAFTAIIKGDGSVSSVGLNADGQLGDGTTDDSVELVDTGLSDAVKLIASTNYAMALLSDNTMKAWGGGDEAGASNFTGVGRSHMEPPADYRAPATVVMIPPGGVGFGEDRSPSAFPVLEDIVDFWTGHGSTWAKTSTNLIYMWGSDLVLVDREAAGSGDPTEYEWPYLDSDPYPQALQFNFVPVDYSYPFSASTIADIQFGFGFGILLKTDGSLVSFGSDYVGQLGRGEWEGLVETEERHHIPWPIPDISGVQAIACGDIHSLALKGNGTVWAWGANGQGQLGIGSTENSNPPVQVVGEDGVGFLEDIVFIECNNANSFAIDSTGQVWSWGDASGVGNPHESGEVTTPVRSSTRGALIQLTICEDTSSYCPPDVVIPPDPLPPFEDDPVITQPSAAKINYEPEKFPDVDVTLPDAPLIPGDPFEFKKPRSLDPPEPFNASQMKMPTPSADPCNSGMPAPGGGVCSPTNPADTPIAQNPTGAGSNLGGFKKTPGVDLHGVGKGGGSGSQESKYFSKDTCYKNEEVNVIIVKLSTLLKLDPSKVQVNEDCDERYTGCFKKGTNIFDALKKMANICGGVFNPGDGGGVVTPPTPKDVHHYLTEYADIFYLERLYDNQDNFAKVEVYRPPKIVNGEYFPGVAKVAEVSTPFEPDLESVKAIYTYDYNLTDAQIQNMANVEASKTSGSGARCQITVLYDDKYKLYQQLHLQRPSINWYTKWMIRTITHTFSVNGQLTVMEATYLGSEGAPVGMMMDDVLLDPVAIGFSLAA